MPESSKDSPPAPPLDQETTSAETKKLRRQALELIKLAVYMDISKGELNFLTGLSEQEIEEIIKFIKKAYPDKEITVIEASKLLERPELNNNLIVTGISMPCGEKIAKRLRKVEAFGDYLLSTTKKQGDYGGVFQIFFALPNTEMREWLYASAGFPTGVKTIDMRTFVEIIRKKGLIKEG